MMIPKTWMPVYEQLGYEKAIKLIKNGTSIDVAKMIIKTMKSKEYEDLAKDSHDLFARD